MWKIKKITLKNIATFVDLEYIIQDGKAILIQGKNLDDEGQESNGSGKSILIESLYTGITGLQFRGKDLTTADMIRSGEKKGHISIEMYNTLFKKTMIINRVLKLKGSNELEVIYDGINQQEKLPTVPLRQKRIIELIDISVEDLRGYYIINKENYQAFFLASDTKKKETIARFSKSNLLDGVEEKVEERAVIKRDELKTLDSQLDLLNLKIAEHEESIENQKDPSEVKNEKIKTVEDSIVEENDSIILINTAIEILDKSNVKNLEAIKVVEANLKTKEKEQKDFKVVDYDKEIKVYSQNKEIGLELNKTLKNSAIPINEEIDKQNKSLKDFKVFKQELETIIEGSIICPKCKHEFVYGKDVSVEEAKALLPEVITDIDKVIKVIVDKEESINKISIDIAKNDKGLNLLDSKIEIESEKKRQQKIKIDAFETSIQSINTELKTLENNNRQYLESKKSKEQSIVTCRENIESYKKRIVALNSEQPKDETIEIKGKIKDIQKRLIPAIQKKIIDKQQELFDIEVWDGNFKRFKSHLANKSIKSIEGYTNLFLQKSKSNLQVEVEGFKLKKDGKLSEKITANILRNGEFEAVFARFSKGEKGRVELMCIIAMQHLINLNCKSGGLDMLFTDEITESIDRLGIENIVSGLNKLNRTINIITHSSHDKTYKNIVTIKKENSISTLN